MKGWNSNLSGIEEDKLPNELLDYVSYLEAQLNVPITLISTGPDRTQTIFRHPATV
jgi:adenylosuccinate synthase